MKQKIEIILCAVFLLIAIFANAQLNIGFKNVGRVIVNGTPQHNKRPSIDARVLDTKDGRVIVNISNGIFTFKRELSLKPKNDTIRPKNNIFYETDTKD